MPFIRTSTGFEYNARGGSDIKRCCQIACAKAKRSNTNVTIKNFNGIDVIVKPTDTVEDAYKYWNDEWERRREAYRNSLIVPRTL